MTTRPSLQVLKNHLREEGFVPRLRNIYSSFLNKGDCFSIFREWLSMFPLLRQESSKVVSFQKHNLFSTGCFLKNSWHAKENSIFHRLPQQFSSGLLRIPQFLLEYGEIKGWVWKTGPFSTRITLVFNKR